MPLYELIDNDSDVVINEITMDTDDELIEMTEIAELLGFRIEEVH